MEENENQTPTEALVDALLTAYGAMLAYGVFEREEAKGLERKIKRALDMAGVKRAR